MFYANQVKIPLKREKEQKKCEKSKKAEKIVEKCRKKGKNAEKINIKNKKRIKINDSSFFQWLNGTNITSKLFLVY